MAKTVRKSKGDASLQAARLSKMSRSAADIGAFMRTFGSEHRVLILSLLVEGERTVTEIERALGTRQAAVSQQLAVLREHNLVKARRDGKRTIYSIADPDVARIMTMLYDRFCTGQRASVAVVNGHDRGPGVKAADQRRKTHRQEEQRRQRVTAIENQRPQAGRVGRDKQHRSARPNRAANRTRAQNVAHDTRQSKHGKAPVRQRSTA